MKIQITTTGQKLIFCSALLFLIGLLQGGFIPYFMNSRMALSAHLAAVQSGLALMIFGLIWSLLALKDTWLKTAYYSIISSMYIVWLAITLSAALGASKALPIAGTGFKSSFLSELLVESIITIGAGLGLIGTFLIVFGLYRGLKLNA